MGSWVRRFARQEPQLMVNVTNDGWFNRSCANEQHWRNAAFRCIELRRSMWEFLQEINSQAKIITDYASTMTREDYQSLLLGGRYEKEVQDTQSGEKMPETFSFENIRMEAPETLWCFLEQIIRGAFGNIIRAKGQFAAGDQFLQFDVADHRYSITGTEQKNAGQAVFIGNDMNEDAIRQYFKKCAGNQKMKYAARHVS